MDEVGSGARSRALVALYVLAIGDALGMPTQSRSRADIVARYGSLLDGFEPGPPGHPLAAGLPAGTVTDDTEQAVLLARLIVKSGGTPDPAELASQLLAWEDSMRARGSLDLLGPSTRQALGAIAAGASIEDAGRSGTTNGAAMRITLGGVATPSGVSRLLGTSLATQESVPAAFAVATVTPQDPWLACRIAASLGGNCDTIAAMTGAICGACRGVESFPESARSTVARVNVRDLGLEGLAVGLLAVRSGTAPRACDDATNG